MSRLRRLIVEIHQRSVWQALVVYLGASYAVLEAAALFRDEFGLPGWLLPVALVLLLIGLPVVVVVSLAREEVYGREEVAAVDAGVAAAEDRRLRWLTWRTAALSLLGAMALWGVIAAGLLLTGAYEPTTASKRYFSRVASNSVAVLPVVNASGDTVSDYLAEGITVELINTLARLPELRVVPRASAFHYRGEPFDPQRLARELGVNAAVTGTVALHGDELFVSIELVDLLDNDQLWGQRYERTVQDIFEIEEDIVASIVEALGLSLTGARAERLGRRYTHDAEAYQLYLRGRHLSQWGSSANVTKAIEYFERAIARDSSFALAYAALSEAYIWKAWSQPPREVFPKAKMAAETALKIDDMLAEAHAALANIYFMYDWDWDGAEREFERALELNPGSQLVYDNYSGFLTGVGRYDDAAAAARWRHELDPLAPGADAWLGVDLRCAGRYQEAIAALERAVEIDPHSEWAAAQLAVVYLDYGMREEAMIQADKAAELSQSGGGPFVGIVQAALGRRENALGILERYKEARAERYIDAGPIAVIYDALGEVDSALVWYRRTIEDRSPDVSLFLNAYPEPWRTTVSDPRYETLIGPLAFRNRL